MAKMTRIIENCPKCGSHNLHFESADNGKQKACCGTCGKETIYDPTEGGKNKAIFRFWGGTSLDCRSIHIYKSTDGNLFSMVWFQGRIYKVNAVPDIYLKVYNERWELEVSMSAIDTWSGKKHYIFLGGPSSFPCNEMKSKWDADHMSVHGDDGKDYTLSRAKSVQEWIYRNIYGLELRPVVTPSNQNNRELWILVPVIALVILWLIYIYNFL